MSVTCSTLFSNDSFFQLVRNSDTWLSGLSELRDSERCASDVGARAFRFASGCAMRHLNDRMGRDDLLSLVLNGCFSALKVVSAAAVVTWRFAVRAARKAVDVVDPLAVVHVREYSAKTRCGLTKCASLVAGMVAKVVSAYTL